MKKINFCLGRNSNFPVRTVSCKTFERTGPGRFGQKINNPDCDYPLKILFTLQKDKIYIIIFHKIITYLLELKLFQKTIEEGKDKNLSCKEIKRIICRNAVIIEQNDKIWSRL